MFDFTEHGLKPFNMVALQFQYCERKSHFLSLFAEAFYLFRLQRERKPQPRTDESAAKRACDRVKKTNQRDVLWASTTGRSGCCGGSGGGAGRSTRVHCEETNPRRPLMSRTSCQIESMATSSIASTGRRLPIGSLLTDGAARMMTRVVTRGDVLTRSAETFAAGIAIAPIATVNIRRRQD